MLSRLHRLRGSFDLGAAAFPFWVWLGSRVALAAVSAIGLAIDGGLREAFRPRGLYIDVPPLDGWCRWDCEWYLSIARDGYANAGQTNFFPLLPLLSRGLWFVTRIPLHWTILIVPNLACLGSYVVLHRLFRRLSGDDTAARAGLALFAAFPFAFFHAEGYPESLMVLLTALSLDLATQGRPFRAGAALAAAALSRHLALLAGLGLLVAQIQQRPSVGRFFKSKAWLALALPLLSLAGYCVYQKLVWGRFFAFYDARAKWGFLATWGVVDHVKWWMGGASEFRRTIIGSYLPFAAIVTGGLALSFRNRTALAPAVFGAALMTLSWSIGLWGMGRYAASCWPAFLGLGVFVAKRPALAVVLLMTFAMFQGLFFYLFIHQFPVL